MERRSLLPELAENLAGGGLNPFAQVVIGKNAVIGKSIADLTHPLCCSGAARV